jgi:hypothetical protein
MDLREMGCEDGRWMELAQDRVQWRALLLAVLNLRVLLPESWLISKMDLVEISCENGRWMELAQDRVQWRASLLAVLIVHQVFTQEIKEYDCLPLACRPVDLIMLQGGCNVMRMAKYFQSTSSIIVVHKVAVTWTLQSRGNVWEIHSLSPALNTSTKNIMHPMIHDLIIL